MAHHRINTWYICIDTTLYHPIRIIGLKPNPTDKSIFTKRQCNCWCTLWAEVHIRRPTGNVSWMMRIQNEQDLATAFPDFPLADMANLFLSPPEESYQYMTRRKIDSMTLGETEYDHLLEEHFERDSVDGKTKLSISYIILPTLNKNPTHKKPTFKYIFRYYITLLRSL